MAIMHLGPQSVPKVAVMPGVIATTTTPIYVTGAGTTGVNRTYSWDGANSRWIYSTQYKIYHDGARWLISNLDGTINYYSNSGGNSSNLPESGWALETGSSPAPTISETAP